MGLQIEGLAQFVAQTQWDDVPEPVQRHTKLVLLDTLGVILAGGGRPDVRGLRNASAGRAMELCEGLRLVSGQAAMQVLPGVLAVGEHLGSSGRDMLAAF